MNHFVFSAVLVFITSFPVAIYFIFKSDVKYYFGLFWLCVAVWTFFVGFQFPLLEKLSSESWGWCLHIGCILVPIVYYHFALHFAEKSGRFLLLMGYALALSFIFLNGFTDLFTSHNIFRTYYNYPKPAVLYPFYIGYFQFYGLLSTWYIFQLRNKIPAGAHIYLYLFLSLHVLAYVGAMDNYLIMYDKLIFPLYPYGLYFVIPYIFLGSLAFLKLQAAKKYSAQL